MPCHAGQAFRANTAKDAHGVAAGILHAAAATLQHIDPPGGGHTPSAGPRAAVVSNVCSVEARTAVTSSTVWLPTRPSRSAWPGRRAANF